MSEHHKPRVTWKSQIGFIFAAIGSCIGLGNIWRFSYMVYKNGGGAFLIPYFVALITAGVPLLILEFGLGHKKHGASSLAFAKISKKFEWLGWWMPLYTIFGGMLFYSVLVSWCLNYVVYSFTLAWGADPQAFFLNDFLQISSGVFDFKGIPIHMFIGVACVWFLIWFICYREINHGVERACTIFMPTLFILTVMLIGWGVNLPGAWEGIKWYLYPDFSKLTNWQVWIAAYGHTFFSLSVGFGIMIAYASYLPKRTNLIKDALITSLATTFYALMAGFAIFSVLGYMALKSGLPIPELVKAGPSLAFIAYPQAISLFPVFRELFGAIFFSALLIAGTATLISVVEASSRAFTDKYEVDRKLVINSICILGFSGSLIFASSAGLYWLDIIDHYLNQYGLVCAGILECLIVGWFLKAHILRNHVNAVSDWKLMRFWDIAINFLTPLILFIILIVNLISEFKKPYGDYDIFALILLGGFWLIGTLLAAISLSLPKWEKEKIEYDHFAEEDKLLV